MVSYLLVNNFSRFSQRFRNQHNILSLLNNVHTESKILWWQSFSETLKPKLQETAQNFEKHIFKIGLDFFPTYIHANTDN